MKSNLTIAQELFENSKDIYGKLSKRSSNYLKMQQHLIDCHNFLGFLTDLRMNIKVSMKDWLYFDNKVLDLRKTIKFYSEKGIKI